MFNILYNITIYPRTLLCLEYTSFEKISGFLNKIFIVFTDEMIDTLRQFKLPLNLNLVLTFTVDLVDLIILNKHNNE